LCIPLAVSRNRAERMGRAISTRDSPPHLLYRSIGRGARSIDPSRKA
jgi:hypothetical protein